MWCRSAVRAHQSKFMNLSWLLLAGSLPLSHAELWRVFRGRRRSIPPGSPVGLTNCGNTCYMNSLLQQLFHTPLVQEAFVDSTLPPGRGVLVAELRRAFGRMWLVSCPRKICPRPWTRELWTFSPLRLAPARPDELTSTSFRPVGLVFGFMPLLVKKRS